MERRAVCDHCGASFSVLGDADLIECPKCGWIVNVQAHQERTSSTKSSREISGPALTPESYYPSPPQHGYEPGSGVVVFGWILFSLVIILPFIGGEAGRGLSGFGVLVSIALVAIDASHIRVKELSYSTLNLSATERYGAVLWAILCWLLWIVAFPLYLAKRQKLAKAAHETIEKGLYIPVQDRKAFRKRMRNARVRSVLVVFLVGIGVMTVALLALIAFVGPWPGSRTGGELGMVYGLEGIDHYNKGVEYLSDGKLDAAESEFKQAIEQNPNLAEAHLNLGLIALENGWLDGAERSTRRCIDILERTRTTAMDGTTWREALSIAYNNMGAIEMARAANADQSHGYGAGRGHWERGMSYFRKAIALDPSSSKAQGNIERFKGAY
ncbi:MAG TPA: tetratricopeptide repeat protein [bacterium]|nr:tetratricopeptide repeat protein [bacterium]